MWKKFFDSNPMQDILVATLFAAVLGASFGNMTAKIWLAIPIGVIVGMCIGRFALSKSWKKLSKIDQPVWLRYVIMAFTALVGAQMGWAALLV